MYANANSLAAYQSSSGGIASSVLNSFGPLVPKSSGYLASKTACLIEDFPEAFRRHPLRKLDLPGAFKTYVRKLLED
jgi:hypothetical protein